MMKNSVLYKVALLICLGFFSCENETNLDRLAEIKEEIDGLFEKNTNFISDGFDFPVGKPNAEGYYNAQKFGENNHLGDDWNGVGGGDTDLGDAIYSISNGYVFFAEDIGGGWGLVIRIIHKLPSGSKYEYIESLYAHCDQVLVKKGDFIKKGFQIGTIGSNSGMYPAHLHFEIRSEIGKEIGPGYSENSTGYLNPTKIINRNRKL